VARTQLSPRIDSGKNESPQSIDVVAVYSLSADKEMTIVRIAIDEQKPM